MTGLGSNTIFDFDSPQFFGKGLGEKNQKDYVGSGVQRRMGQGGQKLCKIKRGQKFTCKPYRAPHIHQQGISDGGENAVKIEKQTAFFERRCKNACQKTNQSPCEHLKRCPWTLSEIKIGDQCRKGADEKACLRAEKHSRDHGERRYGLDDGKHSSHNGKCDHNGNDDQPSASDFFLFESAKKKKKRANGDEKRNERVILAFHGKDAEDDDGGNQNEGKNRS